MWDRLHEEVTKNDLQTVLDLELDLLPILIEMRTKGVRVDLEAVDRAEKNLIKRENKLLKYIHDETGMRCDIWAARSIEEVFRGCGIEYPQTEKGNPSFTKSFLENHPHKIPKAIVEARSYNKKEY